MQKRNILNSPRLLELKKRRQRVLLNKVLLSLFALSLVFGILVYISRTPSLNISEIKIAGNKVVDSEEIKAVVSEEIAGNYLWFFPKANILYYSKKNIENKLHDKFKRLKDISFSIKNGGVLEISVTERTALYTWCGDTINLVVGVPSEEKCYFMDEAGFIFDEAPYFSGDVYFKFYGAIQNFEKLVSFKKALENLGLKPVALSTETSGDVKIFLPKGNSLPTGPEIIFKVDADLPVVVGNLKAALSTEPLLSNFKNKYSSLEYIDLRFGNKVYYKFRP